MSASSSDHNLLFGLLALQNDFLSREELLAAVSVWLTDKSQSLGEILLQRKSLAAKEHQLLASLVEMHLDRHNGNTEQSLASIYTISLVRDDLEQLGDIDINATVSLLPRGVGVSPAQKTPLPVGQAASLPPKDSNRDARFKILRPHARGGLVEVFVAKDLELNRDVALKEIRKDRSNVGPDERTRFVLEAEVNGGLEHPGIVPVYALGQYPDGRPYYAMRFIRGDSLKEAIDRFHRVGQAASLPAQNPRPLGEGAGHSPAGEGLPHSAIRNPQSALPPAPAFDSLDFRKLLTRFITVCNAIEYAHSRGVLHRDLKPANIMLGKYGETLVVDWGLAKVKGKDDQHENSDEQTLLPRSAPDLTEQNSIMGTPAYMSPEQAAGRASDLTPATDVYSLGATLYSLLTGQTPFAFRGVGVSPAQCRPTAPVADAAPQNAAPRTPSENILDRVQAGDFPPPRQLCPAIPKPLEAICLKAMALHPSDRYASSQALADDLDRYLADEPVIALTEPLTLRTRRWLRKHPRSMAAITATLLIGVLSAILIAFIVADRNRRLGTAYIAERAAKESALEREAETSAVLNFVEGKVFAAARPEGQDGGLGHDVTLRRAVEASLPFVTENFRNQPLIEARLRTTMGISFLYLGEAKIAADQFEAARALCEKHRGPDHPHTLASMNNLAASYDAMGRQADALKLREETLAQRKAKLGPDHSDTLDSINNLAASYDAMGRQADALKLREETLAQRKAGRGPDHPDTLQSMTNLANSYDAMGRQAEALKLREETLALRKSKLGPDHPDTLTSMHNLAVSYRTLGRHTEALKLFEAVLALRKAKLGPDHSDTLASMAGLAVSYADLGRHADALTLREEILALQKVELGADHPDTLMSMGNLANSYSDLGRHAEALKLFEETLALQKAKLGPDHPYTLMSMGNLANSYADLGRQAEALKIYEETLALMKSKLGPDHPDTLTSMYNLANSYSDLGRHAEALKLFEETLTLRKAKLGVDHPGTLRSMGNLANSYAALGQQAEAMKLNEETLALLKAKLGPDHLDTLMSMNNLAKSYNAVGRQAEAIRLLEESLALQKAKFGPNSPLTASIVNRIAWLCATCADERCRNGQHAIEYATKACELSNWENPWALNTLAAAYAEAGDFTKAIEWQQKALAGTTSDMVDEFRQRLELYKSGKAYRELSPTAPPESPK